MEPMSKRIAELSPERRRLLDQLLVARPPAAAPPAAPPRPRAGAAPAAPAPAAEQLPDLATGLTVAQAPDQVKETYRQFYDGVSSQLNSSMFGQFSYFLNYGYVPDDTPQLARVALPDHFINRNSARLVLELVGDCDVNGRHVLDVGCGRGGTAYVMNEFFQPASVTGLDLSPVAVAFCREQHRHPRLQFLEGDAERLPFDDASFHVVTNVESSHTYPSIGTFFAEVYRVLKPGGHFLYTDLQPVQQMAGNAAQLRSLGFVLRRDRDITANVLLSCDEIARTRIQAFDGNNDQQLMADFLGAPGSQVYEGMRTRQWVYRILTLQKPD